MNAHTPVVADYDVLPEELRQKPRWLVWRNEQGRKVPYYANGNRRSGALDTPADLLNLVSFKDAYDAYTLDDFSGLGFAVTGEGTTAFDFDHILDDEGRLDPAHPGTPLVEKAQFAGCYIEVSPSGTGLRIFGPCEIADAYSQEGTEYWGKARFLTVTANVFANPQGWVALDDLRGSLGRAQTPVEHEDDEDGPIITPKLIDELADALRVIDADERQAWINMGHALKTLPAEKGLALWLEWSATSPKFERADALATWEGLRPTSTGYRAVFAEARRRGWQNAKSRDVATRQVEGEVLDPSEASEDSIALAFTAQYRDTLRYDFNAGSWFEWDGIRWTRNTTQLAFHYARELGRRLADGQRSMCKANVAFGVERFARADPAHATTSDQWDKDPMLLGTPTGTVDLRTGKLRDANAAELITKSTAVSPEEGTPTLWLGFLNEALGGDDDMVAFLQQWCGYCLTGDTREHALAFLHGPGGNGKSVFINTLVAILGDYATTSTMDTFTASRFEKHSTDLAMLKGARLVTATETEEGKAWAESRIKQLTGGDPITARFMRQDNFTFRPQFKLTIAGNHAPSLRNVDDAMKRRLLIVPFIVKPTKPDPELEKKLRAEHGKILRWAIEGCLNWQMLGLCRPAAILNATEDYFDQQDLFGQWLDDFCETGDRRSATVGALFNSWTGYARAAGDDPGNSKSFASEMQRRGWVSKKSNGVRRYPGLKLRCDDED